MSRKVTGNGFQTGRCSQQMDFFCKFLLQPVLLVHIQISLFNGIQNPICDFRIVFDIQDFFTTVFVVQRYCRTILHCPFEIIHRYVAAEGTLGDVVVGQQRRSGKSDTGRSRKQPHHIIRKDAVLTAVGLVRHDDDVVVGIDRLCVRSVEFLNQRKDETGIAPQLLLQICPAGRDKLAGLCLAQQAAVLKGVADLGIQLVAVGQNHNGGRTGKLAADLLRQEHHGVALAAALCMPEHTQLAVVQLAGLIGFDRLVDAEILVVASKNFRRVTTGMVEENKVLQQIQEVFLFADATQHGFQCHAALFLLRQTLPLVEELIFTAQSASLGLHAVGDDEKGVVIEQVGNGILIVGVIIGVGVLHIHGVLF